MLSNLHKFFQFVCRSTKSCVKMSFCFKFNRLNHANKIQIWTNFQIYPSHRNIQHRRRTHADSHFLDFLRNSFVMKIHGYNWITIFHSCKGMKIYFALSSFVCLKYLSERMVLKCGAKKKTKHRNWQWNSTEEKIELKIRAPHKHTRTNPNVHVDL